MQLEENLISMTSDSSGRLYLGFWSSEGDINLGFNPSYLAGADYIGGQVSVLGEDGNLDSLYEGGLPLSIVSSQSGELYAAIWGQAGRFQPEAKEYNMCGPTKHFWIGLSDNVAVQRLAQDRPDVIVGPESKGIFSHLAMDRNGRLFAFGKSGAGECGIYHIQRGGDSQPLSLVQGDVEKNITALAASDRSLYISDVDGNVYRVGLENLTDVQAMSQPPAPSSAPPDSSQPAPGSPTPEVSPAYRAGHWEGKASVSFDVTDEGGIRNFKIEAPVALSKCVIELERIDVEADGTFVYTTLIKEEDYWPGADRSGETWPTPVMTGNGPMVESIRISGEFESPTTLTGTFRILACGNQQYLWVEGQGTETWSAEWKGPEQVAEAPITSPTPGVLPPTWTPVPTRPPTRLAVVTPTPPPSPTQPLPTPTHTQPAPSPTPTFTRPAPTPTPIPLPTVPPLPVGSWWHIDDLPRQINSLVTDPIDPQVLYAATGVYGAGGGGVYKSEDGGLSWHLAVVGLPDEVVKALAFSHETPPRLYAAVGPSGDIYASGDGAASWSQVGTNPELCCNLGRQLAVSREDGDVLFAVEIGGGGGASYSRDGGQNWVAVRDEGGKIRARSLAMDATDANVVYVGTEGNGVYKSIDGGLTWSAANRGMLDYHITALAVDPAHSGTVYAGGDRGELFKSSDGGGNWEDLTGVLPYPEYGYIGEVMGIALDPAAPETVYIVVEGVGVLISNDGGGRWQLLGKPGELSNPSFTAMLVRFDPQLLLFVGVEDEGGWRYAADNPAPTSTPTVPPASETLLPLPVGSWRQVNGLPGQINSLVADPTHLQVLYAATGVYGAGGGGVYKSEDGGLSWHLTVVGLPDEVVKALAFSHETPPRLYAAVGPSGDIYASGDRAASWTKVGTNPELCCNFGRKMLVSPEDGDVLFVVEPTGGRSASYSRDGGQNWQAVRDERGKIVSLSLAIDPTDAGMIYLGTAGNGVYKSIDGGLTWSAANRGMLDYQITALAVDPIHPEIVYAGSVDGELFKTNDGGESWVDLTDRFLSEQYSRGTISDIFIDPVAPEMVYALVDGVGILVSNDGGGRWQILGKPGEIQYPKFTAAVILFEPQLTLTFGIGNEGSWQYTLK
jgi:photosystem II stability/assembly factor-like uncharacterized protein